MRRHAILTSILLLLPLAACDAPSELDFEDGYDIDGSEELLGFRLFYRAATLWDTPNIPVCWATAGYETEKDLVRKVLTGQESWTHDANINLLGWGQCTGSEVTGIEIEVVADEMETDHLGQKPSGTTVITLDFSNDVETTWPRCIYWGLSREWCIKTMALHELGHALGFDDEDDRPGGSFVACAEPSEDSGGDAEYGVSWDQDSIMNECGNATRLSDIDRMGAARLYGASVHAAPRASDYDGDGRDDILCHGIDTGEKWIDYANTEGELMGTNWSSVANWCGGSTKRLFRGDFNGDEHADLLCHDIDSGYKWIDYANADGQFMGTDWSRDADWCNEPYQGLYVGDFNGDGLDDLLCHDASTGELSVDYAGYSYATYPYVYSAFYGVDWSHDGGWCSAPGHRLYIGDFNGDDRDDLLCHDLDGGYKWIDYANDSGQFLGTNWSRDANWCNGPDDELLIGDFNDDDRDDLYCHGGGDWRVDYAAKNNFFSLYPGFDGTDWESVYTCEGHVSVGDFNRDGHDDFLCDMGYARDVKFVHADDATNEVNGIPLKSEHWWGVWCYEPDNEVH